MRESRDIQSFASPVDRTLAFTDAHDAIDLFRVRPILFQPLQQANHVRNHWHASRIAILGRRFLVAADEDLFARKISSHVTVAASLLWKPPYARNSIRSAAAGTGPNGHLRISTTNFLNCSRLGSFTSFALGFLRLIFAAGFMYRRPRSTAISRTCRSVATVLLNELGLAFGARRLAHAAQSAAEIFRTSSCGNSGHIFRMRPMHSSRYVRVDGLMARSAFNFSRYSASRSAKGGFAVDRSFNRFEFLAFFLFQIGEPEFRHAEHLGLERVSNQLAAHPHACEIRARWFVTDQVRKAGARPKVTSWVAPMIAPVVPCKEDQKAVSDPSTAILRNIEKILIL
jgi:hypothetical protein